MLAIASAAKQENKKNTDRKEISNFVFADDIIIYVENLKKKERRKKEKTAKTPGHTAISKMEPTLKNLLYNEGNSA